jgi:hypothetical protein
MKVDDLVRVLEIPNWLTHDLSIEDQTRLHQQIGKVVRILQLQPHGYLWLSFSDGTEGFSLQPSDVQLVQSSYPGGQADPPTAAGLPYLLDLADKP